MKVRKGVLFCVMTRDLGLIAVLNYHANIGLVFLGGRYSYSIQVLKSSEQVCDGEKHAGVCRCG